MLLSSSGYFLSSHNVANRDINSLYRSWKNLIQNSDVHVHSVLFKMQEIKSCANIVQTIVNMKAEVCIQ